MASDGIGGHRPQGHGCADTPKGIGSCRVIQVDSREASLPLHRKASGCIGEHTPKASCGAKTFLLSRTEAPMPWHRRASKSVGQESKNAPRAAEPAQLFW